VRDRVDGRVVDRDDGNVAVAARTHDFTHDGYLSGQAQDGRRHYRIAARRSSRGMDAGAELQ
jgi:hypothetical protein